MSSSLTGPRWPSFRFTSVNANGVNLGRITEVERNEGRLELSQQATIRGSGELSRAIARGAIAERIKVEYVLDEGTADERAWSLGVYFSASPTSTYTSRGNASSVEVYDGLLALDEDALPEPLYCPVGMNPITEVLAQLAIVGANRAAVLPTSKTLRSALTFKVGTTRLQVVNALLDAIDYFAIWCDGDGVYRIQPYVEPLMRPVEWRFTDDPDTSIIGDEITVEADTYSVPNRVVGISRTNGEVAPLTAEKTITDTSSPYHHSKLGRWRTEVMQDVEVTDQEDLQKKVDRRLKEASSILRKITLRHGWVPITINSVVTLDALDITGRFTVINQSIPFDPKGLVTSTLREVKE